MGVYTEAVQKLYVAYFSRPADAAGLTFWEGVVARANGSTAAVSAAFAASAEYKATFAGQSEYQIINTIYMNLFGRSAEPAALAFWGQGLINRNFTIDNAVTAIAAGAQGSDLVAYNNKVAYATAFSAALDTSPEILGYSGTEANIVARSALANVTTAESLTAATAPAALQASIDAVVVAGTPAPVVTTFNLVAAAENLQGTAGNDIFNGSDTTILLDQLNGGAGNDVLNFNDAAGTDLTTVGLSLNSIETINVRSTGVVTANTTSFQGVTAFNVAAGTGAIVNAGSATSVGVTGVVGNISVDGGNNVTVTDAIGGNNITIGGAAVAAGNITVTDTNAAGGTIDIDGGKNVTVNVTNATSQIDIGQGGAASDLATGAVTVSSANTTGVAGTAAAINVSGGSTITVAQTATFAGAATLTPQTTVIEGAINATAGLATTSINVSQTATIGARAAVAAVANVDATASVKFAALAAGQSTTVAGLTFTASVAMTAAEVANAFSNLAANRAISTITAGDTQSAGPATKGVYTGIASGWTSGAASGDTVVFTDADGGAAAAPIVTGSTGATALVVVDNAGTDEGGAVTGRLGVTAGAVTINDNATAASVTSVTVNGYGVGSTIGATNTLSKLATLNLSNSGSTAAAANGVAATTAGTMGVDAVGITSLALNLNAVNGAVTLDAGGASIKTLAVTTSGANSTFALTAAAVESLTVAGDKVASFAVADAGGLPLSALTALKTVTVSGTAGLTLDSSVADTITSVNTTATTGTVTTSINGSAATYTGGAGVDNVTLTDTAAITKAITLGAGNDTLTLAAGSLGTTVTVAAGDGTDTLAMNAATADSLDGSTNFSSQLTGFERLSITGTTGTAANATVDTVTVNLANLGFTNYVTTAGTADNTDILSLTGMASNGTIVRTGNGFVTVGVTDAATGTADVLNVVLSSAATQNFGTLTAANVETININTVDTNTTAHTDTVILSAPDATLVNVTGGVALNLSLANSTKVATVDASTATGGLTVTAVNTTAATTIKGGAGADVLTAATGTTADVLSGGAGNDVLSGNAGLSMLTGGAGNDVFLFGGFSANSNSYSTVTDFAAGDLLQLTGAISFNGARISLGETAVFQDFANAAVNGAAVGAVSWFQFGGNTYLVMDKGGDSTSFTNGEDLIVKLTGTVDLTNASFNNTFDTVGLI